MVNKIYVCQNCGASFTTDNEHKDKKRCRECYKELEELEIEDLNLEE